MSTLRVSNIEAKADASSPTINEKVKITNSNGDVMLQLDGATSGITTVGINTTGNAFTVDANQNINFTGVVTATSFSGNLTGNVTGNATGITTSQITVGNSFINSSAIGIGSTSTAGRNAGVSTAAGTLIYNATTNAVEAFGPQGWIEVKKVFNEGLTATGGVVREYTDSGVIYKAHIFTTSGTFAVTAPGTYGDTVEYLVVAGGGGGGQQSGGGGGAGGLRTNLSGHPLAGDPFPVSVQSYTVTVGAGGQGSVADPSNPSGPGSGLRGADSSFGSITATGGGGGGNSSTPSALPAMNGGSGGGSGTGPNPAGTGNLGGYTPVEGFPGGLGGTDGGPGRNDYGGGGGGAGGAGRDAVAPDPLGGNGGPGVQVLIAGTAPYTGIGALNPGPGQYQWYAGGGGGANHPAGPPADGGVGGGGNGGVGPSSSGMTGGEQNTGGGGGATGEFATAGANGGSGIVIVRYQIAGQQQLTTAKATGGNITEYGGKVFHTFLKSGTFTVTDASPVTVDHVIIAGGGGGGSRYHGGGGGAGGVKTSIPGIMPAADSQVTVDPGAPNAVSVTVGGGGRGGRTVFPNGQEAGVSGSNSTFGPLTAIGGGGAGYYPGTGQTAGGSGGGAGGGGGTGGGTPDPTQGNPGGAGGPGGWAGGGGGGGAGGAGENGQSVGSPGPGSVGGDGGLGIQLPAAYRDPAQSIGYPGPSGTHWFAGGGGGSTGDATAGAPVRGRGGSGPAGGGTYAGAGDGGNGAGQAAESNSGSGGGGAERYGPIAPGEGNPGGHGGSGIVIISYPT